MIELIGAWIGLDTAIDDDPGATPASRAFEAADDLCSDRPPLPASLGGICHSCSRTQEDPCKAGCAWCTPDLGTACGDDQAAPGILWMV